MKKLNTNKLTEEQANLFKNNLVYLATVDADGNPQVGPSMIVKLSNFMCK